MRSCGDALQAAISEEIAMVTNLNTGVNAPASDSSSAPTVSATITSHLVVPTSHLTARMRASTREVAKEDEMCRLPLSFD